MPSPEDLKLRALLPCSPSQPSLPLSLPSPAEAPENNMQPALPQHHHSCGGASRGSLWCPHRCGTHRVAGYFVRVMRSWGISSGLFRGHRAETKHLGSSEGCIAGHVGRELGDRLGAGLWGRNVPEDLRPGMGLEVGTSHLFPV